MTRKDGQKMLKRYWGIGLAIASAVVYGASVWAEEGAGKTGSLAALAGIGAVVKILIDQNKQDTKESVAQVLTWQSMLAGIELQERLDKIEGHTEERHTENQTAMARIAKQSAENDRLHAEHIEVTNSHAQAITALGDAVSEVKPGFTLPNLHRRKSA